MQQSAVPDEVGLLIAMARRRLKQVVAGRLVRYDLGPQQFWVLLQLHWEEGISLHELALRTWTDDPTACRMVNRLTARGLVRSDSDPDDRRRFRLGLTAKGRKLAVELASLSDDIQEHMVAGLSGRERKQLVGMLQKIIENTNQFEEGAEGSNGKRKRRKN